MTLKLSYHHAEALFNLFNEAVLIDQPRALDERLVMVHMISIYKKLRTKWEGETRKSYNLKVTMPEAIAYRIYWRDTDLSQCTYEWSLIINHCSDIDRELTSSVRINQLNTNLLN
jgi:hypothetical protein